MCYRPLIQNVPSDLELKPIIKPLYQILAKSVEKKNLYHKGSTINMRT